MSEMYDRQEFFKTYFAKASEKPLFLKRFYEEFNSCTKSCNILDLGSHDGALILKLIDQTRDKLPGKVIITAVEPSSDALAKLKSKSLPENVDLECYNSTAEDFLTHNSNRYDWIIASHCLYWTENLFETIQQIANKKSKAVIVLRGEHGIFQIQSKFKNILGNKQEQLYTAKDIKSCLDKLDISFRHEEHQTEISIPDIGSEEFKWLISFFLQTTEDTLSPEDWENVVSFLKPYGPTFRHDVNFFWLD